MISSVSLIDQLVERILHSRQVNAEILHWRDIPSKPGASMANDADVSEIARGVFTRMREHDVVDIDISGFDWSVQFWEMMAEAEVRILCAQGTSPAWDNAVRNRMACLGNAVFVLKDGRMIAQGARGIQKSGSYITASLNSRVKVMLAFLVGCDWVNAYGDDALEDFVDGAEAKYLRFGHIVKTYSVCRYYFDFCSSRVYRDGYWEPITWSKTLFRFLNQKEVTRELWEQFQYTLRYCPSLGRITRYLRTAGGVISDKLYGWEKEECEFDACQQASQS